MKFEVASRKMESKTPWVKSGDGSSYQDRLRLVESEGRVTVYMETIRHEFTEATVASQHYEMSLAELYGMVRLLVERQR